MKTTQIATSLTIGTFIISALTGILIFFEIATGGIRATHEWMSLAFASAGIFHIFTHQNSFFRYFKKNYKYFIIVILFASGVLYTSSMNDIYASAASFDRIVNSKIEYVAPLFELSPEEMLQQINKMNLNVNTTEDSLSEIAKANNVEIYLLLEPLFQEL
ncbi:MAG: hypothetical protein MI863_00530 [Desulfobacterales bacterium]|nr:hypothetical protein [Desulfobacterales bacterium]